MGKDYKICQESCFQYDPDGKGCSFNSMDFNAAERVMPGQRCLHPEFSHDQLRKTNLLTLCNILAGSDADNMDA